MPRIPLTEKSVLKMINDLSSDDKLCVLYPITLSVGLAGSSSEIREHLEKLSDKGILIRYGKFCSLYDIYTEFTDG